MDMEETEDSTVQPDEDTQEQPEVESEESESTADEDISEQPTQDSEEEIPVEELKKGYMRQSDYTKKTQELAEMRKEIEALKSRPTEPTQDQYSSEEREVLNKLKTLGVATQPDVEATIRKVLAQQNLLTEQQRVQQETGLDEDMLYAARALSLRKQISLSDAAKLLVSDKPVKKVIQRKAVSASSGASAPASKGKSREITPEYIRSLDPNSKEFDEVVRMMENGEL